MNFKCLFTLLCGSFLTASASAQLHFPPAFGNDTLNIRQDKITRAYITPRRIVWTSGDEAVKNPELLLQPNTGQSDIFGSGMCVLDSRGGKKASIILDFGRELHGGLSLYFSSVSPAKTPVIRLRFGESLSETCSELNSKSLVDTGSNETMDLKNNTATNDHAVRDMELTVPYYGGIEIGNTGYRFVRIDLLT
ncbi:MAG: alpha-L-rhamnosidase, partial [Bacteroidaceae bacterium]|nr:alpha-L-rhamnosidase [Bacteroidaceae bacterium]